MNLQKQKKTPEHQKQLTRKIFSFISKSTL